MNLFEFDDYQEFLKCHVKLKSNERGYLTRLADGAGCQKSYLSQVIKGHVHFTPEHAMGLALFWNLSDSEAEYFVDLVHLGRTSYQPLKNKIRARLNAIRSERKSLAKRLHEKSIPDHEAQTYYASWIPSALHVAMDIKKLRTVESAAQALGLPTEVVRRHMELLESLGLVKRLDQEWIPSGRNLHLPNSSVFTVMNHQNWRSRALIDSQRGDQGLHYTAVQTLSLNDFERVRELILKNIDQHREIIGPSKSEAVACFCLDWFQL